MQIVAAKVGASGKRAEKRGHTITDRPSTRSGNQPSQAPAPQAPGRNGAARRLRRSSGRLPWGCAAPVLEMMLGLRSPRAALPDVARRTMLALECRQQALCRQFG